MQYFTLQWLNEEKLAQRLIELIHPERDEEVLCGFSIFLFTLTVYKTLQKICFP